MLEKMTLTNSKRRFPGEVKTYLYRKKSISEDSITRAWQNDFNEWLRGHEFDPSQFFIYIRYA